MRIWSGRSAPADEEANLEPAPRGWVEKVYELGSLHVLSAAVVLLAEFHPLSAILGQGPALALLVPATISLTALIRHTSQKEQSPQH